MSDKPRIEPYDDNSWILLEDYGEIPKGFITDCGSIPRLFWRVIGAPTDPQTCGPYIKHDWKYQTACVSREQADEELYDDLREAGIGYFRAKAVYYGVRMFGASHYITILGECPEARGGTI